MFVQVNKQFPKVSDILGNDNLRPILNYAVISKEYIYATNAFVLVRLKTKDYFDQKHFIDKLPDHPLFMDKFILKKMEQRSRMIVTIAESDLSESGLMIKIKNVKTNETVFYSLKDTIAIGISKPLNYEAVIKQIQETPYEEVKEIGIHHPYLNALGNAMGANYGLSIEIRSKTTGMIAKDANDTDSNNLGIIMPRLVSSL
jgi:hypothetical protein